MDRRVVQQRISLSFCLQCHSDAIDTALVALAGHGDQIITSRLDPTHIPADDFPPTRLVALVAGAGVVTVDPLLHHRLVAQVDPVIEHLGDNVGRGRAHRRIR